jgi:hypothetical protein
MKNPQSSVDLMELADLASANNAETRGFVAIRNQASLHSETREKYDED